MSFPTKPCFVSAEGAQLKKSTAALTAYVHMCPWGLVCAPPPTFHPDQSSGSSSGLRLLPRQPAPGKSGVWCISLHMGVFHPPALEQGCCEGPGAQAPALWSHSLLPPLRDSEQGYSILDALPALRAPWSMTVRSPALRRIQLG